MTKEKLPVLRDAPSHPGPKGVGRRDFTLLVLGWVGTLGSMLAASAGALRGLVPNLLDEPNLRYRAAKPTDYLDGTDSFLDEIRIFIQRKGNGYRAMSAVCTHLGCTVSPDEKTGRGFRCPCHGSVFDEDGRVLEGPAPTPLPCYELSMARDGRLVIDRDRPVSADRYLMLESDPDSRSDTTDPEGERA
ncbi:MAG: Rieske (2Fe-2S) protein [Rhodothermales bacterium]|nr:Rieske (2Fe-2S) protein [Rhodothermales bacterium]